MPVAIVIKLNNWFIIRMLTLYRLCFASFFSFVSITLNNISIDFKRYSVIGAKASRLCKKRGLQISKVNDVRFGTVNVYPDEILDEVFATENNLLKAKKND